MIDPDRLEYPAKIADVIGLSTNEIAFLKKEGCPFYGRKTTVAWVRAFIAQKAGAATALAQERAGNHPPTT